MKTTFKKINRIATKVVTTTIILEFGVSKIGKELRNINQVDTCNTTIQEAAEKFADRLISYEEMVSVLKSQEYSEFIS